MGTRLEKAILVMLGIVIIGSVVYIVDASSEYVYFLNLLKEPTARNAPALEYADYVRDTYYYIYKTKLTAGLIALLTSLALLWNLQRGRSNREERHIGN